MRDPLVILDPFGARRKDNGPTVDFDFTSGSLDSRLTFARAGVAKYWDSSGVLREAAAGVPRFDHDPVTKAVKGLLIEMSRTNTLLYSKDYTNAAWTKARITVTANANTAPDGTNTATRLQETAEASFKVMQQRQTFAAGPQTVTVYAKAGERNWFCILISNGGIFLAHYNLTDGTIGTTAGTVTATATHVGDGWYRCRLTWTAVAGPGTIFLRIASASNTTVYTGDGVSGLYIWESQNEVGLFATSQITTTNAAATRIADALTCTGTPFTNWFHEDKGSMVIEASSFGAGTSGGLLFIQNGVGSPRHQMTYGSNGSIATAVVNNAGTVVVPSIGSTGTVTLGNVTKIGYAYQTDDFVCGRDGLALGADNSGDLPTGMNIVRFGFANNNYLNGHLRRFRYWPNRLHNDSLMAEIAA